MRRPAQGLAQLWTWSPKLALDGAKRREEFGHERSSGYADQRISGSAQQQWRRIHADNQRCSKGGCIRIHANADL
eukprot:13419962-Alexandrium_andersonii.AAC.1